MNQQFIKEVATAVERCKCEGIACKNVIICEQERVNLFFEKIRTDVGRYKFIPKQGDLVCLGNEQDLNAQENIVFYVLLMEGHRIYIQLSEDDRYQEAQDHLLILEEGQIPPEYILKNILNE